MADRKISDLTALTTPAVGDFLPIVDISEVAAASKNKRITIEELMRGMPDGTAAAPGIAFETDPNTGIYSPGADQLAVATNGVQRLTVDTAATTSTLPVVHPLGAVGTPSITFTGDLNTGFWSPTADTLAASTAGSERLRITSTGLVGIGTSAPYARTVIGITPTPAATTILETANFADQFVLGNAGPSTNGDRIPLVFNVGSSTNNQISAAIVGQREALGWNSALSFWTNGTTSGPQGTDAITERLRIDSAGRVGIGTTSPATVLDVKTINGSIGITSAGSVGTELRFRNTSGTTTASIFNYGGNNELLALVSDNGAGAGNIVFQTLASERARIDSSGRLLVGTSSTSIASTAILQGRSDNATEGAVLRLARGLNNPADGSSLSALSFTDSGHTNAALIAAVRDGGTWTSGVSQPTRLVFSTTADGSASPTERLRITSAGVLQVADAGNITVGTTTGTKIGTATTQKIGFFNKAPVVQPIAVADATDAATAITQLNALLARMRDLGLIAT